MRPAQFLALVQAGSRTDLFGTKSDPEGRVLEAASWINFLSVKNLGRGVEGRTSPSTRDYVLEVTYELFHTCEKGSEPSVLRTLVTRTQLALGMLSAVSVTP